MRFGTLVVSLPGVLLVELFEELDELEVPSGAEVEPAVPEEVPVELLVPLPGIGTVLPEEELFDVFELLELPGAVKLVELFELFELFVLELPGVFEEVPLGPVVSVEDELLDEEPEEVPVP